MAVTIKDVAKLANVSPSTVTRVIQDKKSISEATKERVRVAMKELNYHPNVNARSLASNRTNVIGVVLPTDSDAFYQNSFFPEVIRGISQIAADHDYLIQLCTGKDNQQRLSILKDTLLGRRVDGFIFLYGEKDDPLVELVIEQEFPAVIVGKSLSPFISLVDTNNEKAGFDATSFLIEQGYQHIAFMSGRHQLFVSQDRFAGYQKALTQQHRLIDESLIYHVGEFTRERGYQTMHELITHSNMDGLVITDALLTEGAIQYLTEHQLNVPIITFDSIQPSLPMAAYVDIHTLELGRSAFDTLLKVIQSYQNKHITCYRMFVPHSIQDLQTKKR